MRYQVKAAVPVAITPAGPVEYPKVGGFVNIPSPAHAAFLQSRGILCKDGDEAEEAEEVPHEEPVVKNLHKMTVEEMKALPEGEFEKLAKEDADMTRVADQPFADFFDSVQEALVQMAKMLTPDDESGDEADDDAGDAGDPGDESGDETDSESGDDIGDDAGDEPEKPLEEMTKDELEAFALKKFGVDIDKRKSKKNIIKAIEELSKSAAGE